MNIKHHAHSVGQNTFHLVWKCKYAWDVFKFPWVRADCEAILHEAADRYSIEVHELQVMPDHIHCFIGLPSNISVAKALQLLKGYSAYKIFRKHTWLRRYFRKGHFWSPGKFFRSVGSVTSEAIQDYIAQTNRGSLEQQSLTRYRVL